MSQQESALRLHLRTRLHQYVMTHLTTEYLLFSQLLINELTFKNTHELTLPELSVLRFCPMDSLLYQHPIRISCLYRYLATQLTIYYDHMVLLILET
jgi:hypothetical protein